MAPEVVPSLPFCCRCAPLLPAGSLGRGPQSTFCCFYAQGDAAEPGPQLLAGGGERWARRDHPPLPLPPCPVLPGTLPRVPRPAASRAPAETHRSWVSPAEGPCKLISAGKGMLGGGWRGLASPWCQLPAPAHKPRLCRELAAACQREPALLLPPAREQMRSDRSSDMEVRSCA